jgi:hypothetical protein
MDLSGMSQNILWELELLGRERAFARTVLLVEASQAVTVQAALDRLLGGECAIPRLQLYSAGRKFSDDLLTAAATNALGDQTTGGRRVAH